MARERPGIVVMASAVNPFAPVSDVAAEFWTEPPLGSVDYARWAMTTAIERGIDVLVAGRGRASIARLEGGFRDAGITVHTAADADTLDLLDDKAAFSAAMAGDPMLAPSIAVRSAKAFTDAVDRIASHGAVACVKPIVGIYGAGYWTLDATGPYDHLADPDARRITPQIYASALHSSEEEGGAIRLLVMEHLPGLEASVDVVADRGRVILAAVRTKLDASRQRIQTRHPLLAHAAGLVDRFALHGAVNVQYREDRGGNWRILEINTRAAGGASYCDAVGIPFSTTWIDVITGTAQPFDDDVDIEIVAVVHAEPRCGQNGSAGTSQA